MVHRGAFTFQSQATGARRPSVGGGGGGGAAGAGAGSFVNLQLLSNSVGSDGAGAGGGGGGESPAAARSHHKGGSGGSGSLNGSFSVEGEEWGIGRVPSDVSRWAGLGVVENLEVREGNGVLLAVRGPAEGWRVERGGGGGEERGLLFVGGHSVFF